MSKLGQNMSQNGPTGDTKATLELNLSSSCWLFQLTEDLKGLLSLSLSRRSDFTRKSRRGGLLDCIPSRMQ